MKVEVATPILIPSLDFLAFLFVCLVQGRITVMWLRAASRRSSGALLWSLRAAILGFDVLIAFGCGFDFLAVLFRAWLPGRYGLLLGAGSLVYGVTAAGILCILAGRNAAGRQFREDINPVRRRLLTATGNVLMAAPFAAMGYGAFIERLDFHVREVDIPFRGLAPDLDGLRLLQLSDIHLSAFLSEKQLARVIDASNHLRADLALITGDLISVPADPLDACIRQLARLKTSAGVFGCMGNHERFARAERHAELAGARAGIAFLRGSARPLRFGNSVLNLAGVDYQTLHDRASYLRGAERLVRPGALNVLMSHNPDVFPVAARQGYDLVLAGHTHGGQISVEILDQNITPARFLTPYVYGLFRSGSSAEYVSRGIGTIGIPARIGAPPEISILRLRKA